MQELILQIIPSLENLPAASSAIHLEVDRLNDRYATCLDSKRYKEWPGFFSDTCVYRIHSAENIDCNLPGSIVFCDSQEMLHDRILCITEVSVYAPHRALHVLGRAQVVQAPDDSFIASANFAIYHTDIEGRSRLYAVGQYRDIVVQENGEWRFRSKVVVLDTYMITSHLAEPL